MAQAILKTIGKAPNDFRDDPNYARLIDLLRGHPKSLEVVLTQLRFESPGEIIEALQSKIDSCKDLLDASFEYVFEHLSPETRRHLPLIGLFTTYTAVPTIGYFGYSGLGQAVYKEHTGEYLVIDSWKKVLMEAAFAGLVRQIHPDLFELHPTLPTFLRNKLADQVGLHGVERLDAEFTKLYAGLAGVLEEKLKKAEPVVSGLVGFEEPNFLRALRLAELGERWSSAQAIVQLISIFYDIRSRHEELRSLRSGIFTRLGRTINADASNDKIDLWMFLQSEEANDAIKFNDLNHAEMDYKRILGYLVSLNDPNVDPKIAICHNKLGIIAAHLHKLDEAEQRYKKAQKIFEHLGLEQDAAASYHQLGIIDQTHQNLNGAEAWYKKALKIYERLGIERDAAKSYHQLGMVAQDRQKSDEAEQWYGKALEIHERLGLEQEAAAEYTQLGSIAYLHRKPDEAEQWYKKALKIRERLALELDAAKCYHGLGMVAQYRQKLDEAEQWYKKALEIYERHRLELEAADLYILLGTINQNLDEAYESYRDALDVYDRVNNLYRKVDTLALMGILRRRQDRLQEAIEFFGRSWVIAREYQMSIAESISLSLASLMLSMGEQEFVTSWRQAFHEEPPLEALRAKAKYSDE
ncbi:MAG: tetratricopeptide repeat protein [Methanothrix sp.]|nr:tetratricopeptide repeat protein [Methanothrix sp.]